MRKFTPLAVLFFFAFTVQAADFINGQAARAVLGQAAFSLGNSNPSQTILGGASGLAYDPKSGRLYVADSNRIAASPQDHRVLIFDTNQIPSPYADLNNPISQVECAVCGFPAISTLGQPSFTPTDTSSGTALFDPAIHATDPTLPQFNNATAVATDGNIVAVADTDNNRVLIWTSPPAYANQPPNLVLGQPDLLTRQTQGAGVVTATTMRGPQGVWIQNNKLFVADTQNFRILIWNSIPTVNNQAPNVVLGQADFTHATAPAPTSTNPVAAANTMLNPVAVTSDGTHLFVADLGFNRILIWNAIPATNFQNADVEIGQPDMTQTAADNPNSCAALPIGILNQCQANLNFPRFALADPKTGRLFVADGGNDRVLIYNHIPTANGASADLVLGQPDFTTDLVSSAAISIASTAIDNTGAVDTTPTPTSLAFDGVNLYVADAYNRRILLFTPGDSPLPAYPNYSVVNWASEVVRQEALVTMAGTIVANDTVTITIQSVDYAYTVTKTDTLDTVAQGLIKLINATDPNVTAVFGGVNSGTVYLSSKAVNLAYDSITLAATTSNSTDITATASGGYLSAGNAATGAAGMLIEVNAPPGVSFTDGSQIIPPLAGVIPQSLGGVELFVDGYASPLFKVSKTQIVGQIPYYYFDRNSSSVYVRTVHNDGTITVTNASPIYIAPANPGIFNAPSYPNQPRPWPASQVYHQPGNPTAVVSIDGSVTAKDTATITVNGTNYTYTVVATDTLLTIAQNLVTMINQSDPLVTAALGGAFDRVVLTAKQAGAAGTGISIAGSSSTSATVTVTAYSASTCCNVTPGSVVSAANPAGPGELIIVNAAGLGAVDDINGNFIGIQTGQPYPTSSPVPNSAASFVAATMGGVTAQVVGAGFAPGSYGTYQIQTIVPTTLTPNAFTPFYVAQNAFISNTVTVAVGTPVPGAPTAPPVVTPSPFNIYVDEPGNTATLSGVVVVRGWALDSTAPVVSMRVLVDGASAGTASYGVSRPDVCAAYPGSLSCPNVGWSGTLDTTTLTNGSHTLQFTATDSNGANASVSETIIVSNSTSTNPTQSYIDVPGPGFTYHGALTFSGWAVNSNTAINSVAVSIDGAVRGNATYGVARADVCAVYPSSSGCPNVGWSYFLDTNTLSNGTHTFGITATAANGQKMTIADSFLVANWIPGANPVQTYIDVPSAASGVFSGTAAFQGWVLDANTSISNVTVAVDGVVYSTSAYNVPRPDVCAAYPGFAGCPNVGWSATIDTTQLADGNHTLSITAFPTGGQGFTTTTTFSVANLATVANPVRIYVDTPQSTAISSGMVNVSGWAIADTSAISSVQIRVDGVLKGSALYGDSRLDVCTVYPGRVGCPNVGWHYLLDTALLTDGSHAVEITASTALGARATTSQTIMVSNNAGTGPARIYFDTPNGNSNPFSGKANFYGWAIHDNVKVNSVSVTIDGIPYGSATYGASRPDVCAVYPGRAGCPNVGWTFPLDTTQLIDGTHTFGITEVLADNTFATASSNFVVANWSTANPMTIYIDAPTGSNSLLFGPVSFYGWAVDTNGSIASVSIAMDGVPYGNATYGLSRPDVCSNFASQNCPGVGWSFSFDTNLLLDGTHTVAVTGTTSLGQSSTTTAAFTVVN